MVFVDQKFDDIYGQKVFEEIVLLIVSFNNNDYDVVSFIVLKIVFCQLFGVIILELLRSFFY